MRETRKCWVCGKDAVRAIMPYKTSTIDFDDEYKDVCEWRVARQFCQECYDAHTKKIDKQREEYARLKKSLMFERAIRTLEEQRINLYEFKDIVEQMGEYVEENPSAFDSAQEMIAAIILVGHGIKIKPQYKIEKYRVDFLIPSMKVVLEIDGHMHQYRTYKDNKRDVDIRACLGHEWEVVRIPTKCVDDNAKQLIPAIIEIREEKKKIRSENHGIIPEWYSGGKIAT